MSVEPRMKKKSRIMKYLLLFALTAAAMATEDVTENVTETVSKDRLAENFANVLGMNQSDAEICTRQWNTTSDDIFYIQQVYDKERENDDPVLLKRISCALHCCFEKQGLILEREIQIAKFNDLDSNLIIPPEVNARDVIRTCEAQVKDIPDKCLLTFEFGKCAIRRFYSL
ncbi:uncharacterized protein LOC116430632 [Nomia melanderi]|uniref:uncharacterized protein LOC116430632 n=1 Tax=Nomia melanderi TaxID=2448451 RepID=UPI001303F8EF|nr:uncharacterized protein LOC116430632 [Nomia melanderi]